MSRPLRVLVLGLGLRGEQWARALRRARAFELVGVADPEAGAPERAARIGTPHWPDPQAALAEAKPAAALVATPAVLHAAHALACVEQGCAVLVEKPLATSLADARRVSEAAANTGTPVLVAQNFRFRAVELTLRRALDGGAIGSPRSACIVSARTESPPPAAAPDHWPLWEFCVHHVDLWRARLGRDPEQVEADLTADGAYTLRLRFRGDVEVLYRHRDDAPCFHWYEWVEGEHGALAVELERVRLHSSRHRPRRLRRRRAQTPESVLLAHLAEARGGRGDGGLGAVQNLGTIAALEAAVASIRSGQAEPVRAL